MDEDFGILPMPPGVSAEDFIGAGTSGICFRYRGTSKVIKIPLTQKEEGARCRIEAEIYNRLQNLPDRPSSILQYYGSTDYGIELAYASNGSVREHRAKGGQVTNELLYRWALSASEAIGFCHNAGIIHSDINCRNFLVDSSLQLLLADFAGSSIDGQTPLVAYSSSYRQPGTTSITIGTEIFAFGSLLYELVTERPPEIKDASPPCFPDTCALQMGTVIQGYWRNKFSSIDQVRQRIKDEMRGTGKGSPR